MEPRKKKILQNHKMLNKKLAVLVRQNKGDKQKILNVLSNCKTATTNNVPELSVNLNFMTMIQISS